MTNADCPYKAECDRKGEHVAPNCPTSNADLIAEARALDAEATKGPWRVEHDNPDPEVGSVERIEPDIVSASEWEGRGGASGASLNVSVADAAFIARSRTLLPQLADALEAAETKIGIMQRNIEFNEKAYLAEHVTWGNCQWKARLVKVRERAIRTWSNDGVTVIEAECRLCGAEWREPYEDRDHQPADCPARPMEDA